MLTNADKKQSIFEMYIELKKWKVMPGCPRGPTDGRSGWWLTKTATFVGSEVAQDVLLMQQMKRMSSQAISFPFCSSGMRSFGSNW